MTPEKLIGMANQIASYFAADPDTGYARGQIADHLRRFWSPAMRRILIEHLDSSAEATGLDALAAAAIAEHRERLVGTTR